MAVGVPTVVFRCHGSSPVRSSDLRCYSVHLLRRALGVGLWQASSERKMEEEWI